MTMNQGLAQPLTISALNLCIHCGSEISVKPSSQKFDQNRFCCNGCEFVYGLLNAKGLSRYYELRDKAAPVSRSNPVSPSQESFSYLDDAAFKQSFCGSESALVMDFYLEGIHCVACLWLIEKLPVLVSDVAEARLDFGRSMATVKILPGGSFARVALELERLGYRPHPVQKDEEAEDFLCRENRSWLVKLGVAGACSGNIMLLAVSLYAGASGTVAEYFRWISMVLFLPVVCYSALPFYKSSWTAIKTKTLSIDVPIVVAIVVGSIVSVFHTFSGSEHVYYDSLSALIFLLLSSRYFLRRMQQKTLGQVHLLQFLAPASARLFDPALKQFREVSSHLLRAGDQIEVLSSSPFPVDGVVVEGSSSVNCSLLTGESQPQRVAPGDLVFAGTINEGASLRVDVKDVGDSSRLGQILKGIQESSSRKAAIVQVADRLSKWFLAAVILSALGVFAFASNGLEGINRALALMIVTCPCALALATPLTMSLALRKAAAAGMLVKNADVIEKLSQIRTVILDKTGTITTGHFEVFTWTDFGQVPDLEAIVIHLESASSHPVAKALVRYLSKSHAGAEVALNVEGCKEVLGVGVEGFVDGVFFEVKSLRESATGIHSVASTNIGVYRAGVLVAQAALGDFIREDSQNAVKSINKLQLETFILSGDRRDVVKSVAAHLEADECHAIGEADPVTKRDFVEAHPRSLMVGDGANDALALSAAYVSAAVHGSMEASLRVADVYLSKPGVFPIYELILLAKRTMGVMRRNLVFSIFYNLVGGAAAATGHITPLMAALLMPLSALTVFSSSMLGSRKFLSATASKKRAFQ